jgi:hypothetical protein
LSENKWQVGPVKLANGEDAFIDAINEEQEHYRYIGRIRNFKSEWIAAGWHANGRLMWATAYHPGNLAPPPKKKVRVQRWLNIDADGTFSSYELRSEADTHCFSDRIACIEIDIEVEEGEGI